VVAAQGPAFVLNARGEKSIALRAGVRSVDGQ